jgi:hypothetical protein
MNYFGLIGKMLHEFKTIYGDLFLGIHQVTACDAVRLSRRCELYSRASTFPRLSTSIEAHFKGSADSCASWTAARRYSSSVMRQLYQKTNSPGWESLFEKHMLEAFRLVPLRGFAQIFLQFLLGNQAGLGADLLDDTHGVDRSPL